MMTNRSLTADYEKDALAGKGNSSVGEGGTLTEPFLDKLGVFVTPAGRFGDKSNSGKLTGYDFYTAGLTVGADYRVRNHFALRWCRGLLVLRRRFRYGPEQPIWLRHLSSNSVIFSFFGTYFPNNDSLVPVDGLFLDGMASFGWSFFDMSRRVLVPNTNNPALPAVNERANSDTTAFQYGFAGNLGYQFSTGRSPSPRWVGCSTSRPTSAATRKAARARSIRALAART